MKGRINRLGATLLTMVAMGTGTMGGFSGALQAGEAQEVALAGQANLSPWKEFHSSTGKCKLRFPNQPQHVSENIQFADEGYTLRYDAYVSATDPQTVYMLLIAQYPDFVDQSYARGSLESFLNGIINHNPNNQLLFADLLLVDGHEALDFFIRTGGLYFQGRALMINNSLYLMAMECEMCDYNEQSYKTFVTSFELSK